MTTRPSIWFRAVGLAATLFVLTVFVMIAGLFSDPNLPLNQWLNRHGVPLLLGEIGLLITLGMVAMLTDARPSQNLDQRSEMKDQSPEIMDERSPSLPVSDP